MKTPTLNEVLASPMQYLYAFASDSFIANLSSDRAKIIYQKRANAQKIVNTSAIDKKSTSEVWLNAIRSAIIKETGKTPAEVLIALASGKTVAGKNWQKGIYGIGDTPQQNFVQNSGVTVDPTTGLMSHSSLATTQTPMYNSNGTVIGYTALTKDGSAQYQSVLYNGTYSAYSYGNASGAAQYANGKKFDMQTVESIFQGINTLLPYVSSIVNQILAASGKTAITYANTAPAQSDWVENDSDNSGLLLLAVGAGALALFS